jgi:hypothetical protein
MKNILLYATIVLTGLFVSSCEKDYDSGTAIDGGADMGNIRWIKQFAIGKKTYFVTFSSKQVEGGINPLQATIYLENMQSVTGYKIEIDPRMPDMENHSSPSNRPLEWNVEKNVYEGTLNITMTGWWRLNLKIYNEAGNLIGGSDVVGADFENGGSSTIYWDIEI